MVANNCWRMDG